MYPQFGHVYDIWSLAISPDGRYLVSGSRDETIRLWELQTGILIHTFDARAEIRSIQFSPDGRLAIAGDVNGRVSIWDLESRKMLRTFPTNRGSIGSENMGIFPDGRRIVTGHALNNLHVWDLETGRLIQSLGGDEIRFRKDPNHVRVQADAQAILPDGRHVLGGYKTGQIKLWDAATGAQLWEMDAHDSQVQSIRVTRDGKYFYSGSRDGLRKWRLTDRQLIRHYAAPTSVWGVNLTPDESKAWLAVGGSGSLLPNDNRVVLLDLRSGSTTTGPGMSVSRFNNAARLTPDGHLAAAGDSQGSISLWNTDTGELCQTLRGSNGMLNDVAVSPNGLRIATASMDKNVYLWNAEVIAPTATLRGHTHWPNTAVFSPSGTALLTSARQTDYIRLWDLATNRNLRTFDPGGSAKPVNANAIAFTPDGRQVVTCNFFGEVRLFQVADGRMSNSFQLGGNCDSMALTTSGRQLLAGVDDTLQIRAVDDGSLIDKINLPTNGVDEVSVSSDGVHVAVALLKGVYLIDLNQRRVVRTLATGTHEASAFSPDGRYLAAASYDRTIKVWERQSIEPAETYRGHTGRITSLHFSGTGRQIISSAKDGSTKIWNRATGEATTLLVRDGEWLAYTDDGYFDASRKGGELAAIVSGMKGFRIDQLAARNNRPDVLLDRIGVTNPQLKAHFEALYRHRLRKLGLTEAALSSVYQKAPEVKLLQVEQSAKRVLVRFAVRDSHYDLVSYNIYVNDVPLYGARGKPISGNSHTLEERVELTSGSNKIEVSALNRVGVESLRDGRVVTYAPTVPGDLYYLGFGVSNYRDPALSLKFAAKDATDLEALLRSAGGFRNVHTRTYVDAQVTVNTIKQAKDFLKSARVDDTVVLFVAGHGLYGGSNSTEYYYVTYDTDLNRLETTAADFESFEELLQVVAPRRKLFLMDTCQSGESQSDLPTAGLALMEQGQLRSRGIRVKDMRQRLPSLAMGGLGSDRSRYIYNDLFRRSGAIVLSSSRGSEMSYERDDLRNGVFTETVISALSSNESDANRDGRVSTDELREYVISRVPRISAGMQHPVVDRDNLAMVFSLPLMAPVE